MRILKVNTCDATNGPGVRYSIWIAGCHFHCKDCWNPESWNFNQGTSYDDCIDKIINDIKNRSYIQGISILGGEPLSQYMRDNDQDILKLCKRIKEETGMNIWLWTGYNWEDIRDKTILKYIDTIITGRFEIDKRDIHLKYMGSSNQEIHYIS